MSESRILHYQVDPSQSSLHIYTSNSGLFAAAGHKLDISAQQMSGSLSFDPKTFAGSLDMKVPAQSLTLENVTSPKDRKEILEALCTKVLECELYPFISFKSSAIQAKSPQSHEIQGEMQLHGVRRSLPIQARIQHASDQLIAEGEFKLKQSDFNIKPPTALGGSIKVKDEVKISFRIVALPQKK